MIVPYTTLVDTQTVADNLADPNWVLVDCRFDMSDHEAGYQAYLQQHIPGAVYAHLENDLSGPPLTDRGRHPLPSPEAMQELFSQLGIHTESQVVVYDDSGGAIAARLWWMLRYMSHQSVAVLDGGWPAWAKEPLPTRSGQEQNPAGDFQGEPRWDRLVTITEIPAAPLLVDSRAPERYAGIHEPYDPQAGHIPRAVNYHFAHNWTADQQMRPAGELKQQFTTLIAEVPAAETVFYCGSGVSACYNILAQLHAGLPEGRLYVGSWSEWCADEDRPVATISRSKTTG